MTAFDVLNQWMKYSQYDPDRKRFNLLDSSYDLHRYNKSIEELVRDYDPTGSLAVLMAKTICESLLQSKKVSLYQVLTDPDYLTETRAIWELFSSPEVKELERQYLDTMDKLIEQVTGHKMMGLRDDDQARNTLASAIYTVVDQLRIGPGGCNADLFMRGGVFQPITKFSTHIHVFERLAECLLALETASDGMYLCYISESGTASGYFGFFLKSSGNLLSINERPDEVYIGQHKRSRNARWSESKKYDLFPYQYLFSFEEHDYKGYATKHIIDVDKLSFLNLEPDAYIPLLLGMVMLSQKYAGKTLDDMPLKLVDSLLKVNILSPAREDLALAVPSTSALVTAHEAFTLDFTPETVLDGSLACRFDDTANPESSYLETGHFRNRNQFMVDMYGKGFTFDPAALLLSNQHLRLKAPGLAGNEEQLPNSECVGTPQRLAMQAYLSVRQQLAEYMRDRIYEEYAAFGGLEAVKKWWQAALERHAEDIYKLIAARYQAIQSGEEVSPWPGQRCLKPGLNNRISFSQGSYPNGEGISPEWVLNYNGGNRIAPVYHCPITGAKVSLFFTFKLLNWQEMELLLGEEVPKIVKGWQYDGHSCDGNPLLDATDPVEGVGTPFEKYQSSNHRYSEHVSAFSLGQAFFDFRFSVGFSKRGIKQLVKKYPA